MAKTYDYNKALSYSYRLINYRPRSKNELIDKLKTKKCDGSIMSQVIDTLTKQGAIDDVKFSRLWAQERIQQRSLSLNIIKQELLTKGVDIDVIERVLSDISQNTDELKIAMDLAQKRIKLLSSVDGLKKKKRLFDYLKRRGFSSDIVYQVLNEVI